MGIVKINQANIRLSWYFIVTSVILRILFGIITLMVVAERTLDYLYFNEKELPIGFLLISGWLIAILALLSAFAALIGVLLDTNL